MNYMNPNETNKCRVHLQGAPESPWLACLAVADGQCPCLAPGAGFNLENELAEGPIYCEAINRVRGARGLGAVPPARRRLPPGGPGKGREGARRRRRSEAISLQRFKKIVKSAVDFHGDRMQLMFPFWSGCPLDG